MNKREEFEKMLSRATPVNHTELYAALDDVIDEAYDDGYNEGFDEAEARELAASKGKVSERLRERLTYLQLGGGFHRETTGDLYIQGFLDAMATLGVKP